MVKVRRRREKKERAAVSSAGESGEGLKITSDQFVGKIRERVRTSFYLRHNYKTLKMELLSYFIKTQEVPLG